MLTSTVLFILLLSTALSQHYSKNDISFRLSGIANKRSSLSDHNNLHHMRSRRIPMIYLEPVPAMKIFEGESSPLRRTTRRSFYPQSLPLLSRQKRTVGVGSRRFFTFVKTNTNDLHTVIAPPEEDITLNVSKTVSPTFVTVTNKTVLNETLPSSVAYDEGNEDNDDYGDDNDDDESDSNYSANEASVPDESISSLTNVKKLKPENNLKMSGFLPGMVNMVSSLKKFPGLSKSIARNLTTTTDSPKNTTVPHIEESATNHELYLQRTTVPPQKVVSAARYEELLRSKDPFLSSQITASTTTTITTTTAKIQPRTTVVEDHQIIGGAKVPPPTHILLQPNNNVPFTQEQRILVEKLSAEAKHVLKVHEQRRIRIINENIKKKLRNFKIERLPDNYFGPDPVRPSRRILNGFAKTSKLQPYSSILNGDIMFNYLNKKEKIHSMSSANRRVRSVFWNLESGRQRFIDRTVISGDVGLQKTIDIPEDCYIHVQYLNRHSVYNGDDRLKIKPNLVRIPKKYHKKFNMDSTENISGERNHQDISKGVLNLFGKLTKSVRRDLSDALLTHNKDIFEESDDIMEDDRNAAGKIFDEISGGMFRITEASPINTVFRRKQPIRVYDNHGASKVRSTTSSKSKDNPIIVNEQLEQHKKTSHSTSDTIPYRTMNSDTENNTPYPFVFIRQRGWER